MRAVILLIAGASVWAQQTPVVFAGARVMPVVGSEISNGVVGIQDGKIRAVGGFGVSHDQGVEIFDLHEHGGQP
jgi:imidazolonepropionase-like amidohydrolase